MPSPIILAYIWFGATVFCGVASLVQDLLKRRRQRRRERVDAERDIARQRRLADLETTTDTLSVSRASVDNLISRDDYNRLWSAAYARRRPQRYGTSRNRLCAA